MQNVSLRNSIIASLKKIVLKSYSVAKKSSPDGDG